MSSARSEAVDAVACDHHAVQVANQVATESEAMFAESEAMFVVCVEFVLVADRRDDFLPLMLENARQSREEEPGCRQFDVCVDPQRAERIFLYELYNDRAAFDAHLQTEHFKRFNAATEKLIQSKLVSFWQRLD